MTSETGKPAHAVSLMSEIDAARALARETGSLESIDSTFGCIDDGGVRFFVRVGKRASSSAPKPELAAKKAPTHMELHKKESPFLPPFEPGLFVKPLGPDHRLILNKYNVISRHLLICSREFRLQGAMLSLDDIKATFDVLQAVDGLAFYNSGANSGHSQQHFHLQVVPVSSIAELSRDKTTHTSPSDPQLNTASDSPSDAVNSRTSRSDNEAKSAATSERKDVGTGTGASHDALLGCGLSKDKNGAELLPIEPAMFDPNFPRDAFSTLPSFSSFAHAAFVFSKPASEVSADDVYRAYRGALEHLGFSDSSSDLHSKDSYNFLFTTRWVLLVRRSRSDHHSSDLSLQAPQSGVGAASEQRKHTIGVNSLGFCGLFYVKNPEIYEYLRATGPLRVLESLAVKTTNSTL